MWKGRKAKKPIVAVSSYATKEHTNVVSKQGKVTIKTSIIEDYNQFMNGCDRMDQMVSYYNVIDRKTKKWWKGLFIWTVELTQGNSFILFSLTREQGQKRVPLLMT